MRLRRLRGTCNDGKTCPTLYATDRGTLVIQGYTVGDSKALDFLRPSGEETAVEVPATLLGDDGEFHPALYATGRGTVIVKGHTIEDPQALAMLELPGGETVVEVPAALLREVFGVAA